MTTRKAFLGFLAALVIGCLTAPALATDGPYFGGYCWGYGAGFPQSVYMPERMPYYALYPPVYYSRPVARPYGHSPFAPPFGTIPSADVVLPVPPASPTFEPVCVPLTIANPYVRQADGEATAQPTATPGPRPLVIHPATIGGKSL